MLSQVIPRGLNSGLVQEAEMRNHVRSFGKGSFIHPRGNIFFFNYYYYRGLWSKDSQVIVFCYIWSTQYRPALMMNLENNFSFHSSSSILGLSNCSARVA